MGHMSRKDRLILLIVAECFSAAIFIVCDIFVYKYIEDDIFRMFLYALCRQDEYIFAGMLLTKIAAFLIYLVSMVIWLAIVPDRCGKLYGCGMLFVLAAVLLLVNFVLSLQICVVLFGIAVICIVISYVDCIRTADTGGMHNERFTRKKKGYS